MATKLTRRPSRAKVLRSLAEMATLWRMPEKDKPGTRGGEQTGPDTSEHFDLNSTPCAKRKAMR